MGSKNERHEEKWGEKVTFLLIFLSYFPLVPSPLNPAGGGTWPKSIIRLSHLMKFVPHTIPLLLSLSADDFAVPFHIQKSSQITTKKSKYLSTTTFQWLTCENTPFYLISLCRYSWSKTLLKHGKWLSLLVAVGQISPGIWLKPLMRGQEPTVPGFALFFFFKLKLWLFTCTFLAVCWANACVPGVLAKALYLSMYFS